MDSLPTELLTMILSIHRDTLKNTGDNHGNKFLRTFGSVCKQWHAIVVRILSASPSTFVTLRLINNQKGKLRQTRIQKWIQRHCPLMMGPLVSNDDRLRPDDLLITFNNTGYFLPSPWCRKPLVKDYVFPLTQSNLSGLSAVLAKARATFRNREVKVDILVSNTTTHVDHVRKAMIPLIVYLRNYHSGVVSIQLHSNPHNSYMKDCVALWDNHELAVCKGLWMGIINEYVRTSYGRSVHDGEIAFRAAKTVFDLMDNQNSFYPGLNEAAYQYAMLHYIRIHAWNRDPTHLVHEGMTYAAFMRKIKSMRESANSMIAYISSSSAERYDMLYEFGLFFVTICSHREHHFIAPGFPSATCLLLSDIASGLTMAVQGFNSAYAERADNAASAMTTATAVDLSQVQRNMGTSPSYPTIYQKPVTINGVPDLVSEFQYAEWLRRIPNGGSITADYSRHSAPPVPLLASGRSDTRYDVTTFFDHWNSL